MQEPKTEVEEVKKELKQLFEQWKEDDLPPSGANDQGTPFTAGIPLELHNALERFTDDPRTRWENRSDFGRHALCSYLTLLFEGEESVPALGSEFGQEKILGLLAENCRLKSAAEFLKNVEVLKREDLLSDEKTKEAYALWCSLKGSTE